MFKQKTADVRVKRVAVPAAVLAAVCVLGACGGSGHPASSTSSTAAAAKAPARMLNTKRVALAIEQSVQQQRNRKVSVTCPASVVQRKGVSFQCTATSKATGSTKFDVTQTNDQGFVTYAAR